MTLSSRQGTILNALVGQYIQAASPVSSDSLVKQAELGVSSATLRNEMAVLEDGEFIVRPYTSSGAVPSPLGYRHYVETGVEPSIPEASEIDIVNDAQGINSSDDLDARVEMTARFLAEKVANVAFVTFPRAQQPRIRRVELVHLEKSLVLLIVVLQGSTLRKGVLHYSDEISQDILTSISNRLNDMISGRTSSELSDIPANLPPLMDVAWRGANRILRREADSNTTPYVYGLTYALTQPEFAEAAGAQSIIELTEDPSLLQDVLHEHSEGVGGVKVRIGPENSVDLLHPFSVITARYGSSEGLNGTLGVLGPTRMEYRRTIAIVQRVSIVIDDLMEA